MSWKQRRVLHERWVLCRAPRTEDASRKGGPRAAGIFPVGSKDAAGGAGGEGRLGQAGSQHALPRPSTALPQVSASPEQMRRAACSGWVRLWGSPSHGATKSRCSQGPGGDAG